MTGSTASEAPAAADWGALNQQYLFAHLTRVRLAIAEYAGVPVSDADAHDELEPAELAHLRDRIQALGGMPPLLDQLSAAFHLSDFERDVVLLCAGMELDGRFAPLFASASPSSPHPTLGLAMAALSGGSWLATNPDAPLRRWHLVELDASASPTSAELRAPESVVRYLVGVASVDTLLVPVIRWVARPGLLTSSQQRLADRITTLIATSTGNPPAIQLHGADPDTQHAIAAAACEQLGLSLAAISAHVLPSDAPELERFGRIWTRDRSLGALALLIDCHDVEPSDARQAGTLERLLDQVQGPVFVAAARPAPLRGVPVLTLEASRPSADEQQQMWTAALGEHAAEVDDAVQSIVAQFDLSPGQIEAATRDALLARPEDASLESALWDGARVQARPRIDDLAERIDARADWGDLVVPEATRDLLQQVLACARQRHRVSETWGFAQHGARGLGIATLFAGPSGTGKTMAAEVLARDLRVDVYRVDLSSTISKYIGETEKHLRRIFDAAERGGAILLFDEADALFGKRTEVKDSHDRYANVEVSYLLQRMEAYRGLAILTTNREESLDAAFLRRLRFVVRFPFPDLEERTEIWKRAFPEATPTVGLDAARLAQLNIAGGTIRNVALVAASLAADEGTSVSMAHIARAAHAEYAKLKRPLTASETAGWS